MDAEAKQPALPAALDALDKTVSLLADEVYGLEKQLAPILPQGPEVPPNEKTGTTCSRIPLVAQVDGCRGRLQELNSVIAGIKSNCAL